MKKLLAMVLCVAMVLSMMAFTVSAESTADVWDGVTATTDWYYNNPNADVFYINSASDLAGLAQIVNKNTRTDWHPFYKTTIYLNVDIDLNQKEWTPIGTSLADKTGFYGNFDGQNHTISNLWISNWSNDRAGLFGYTHVDAEGPRQQFKNFTVENATVTSSKNYVAAVIASAFVADIDNVHLKGDITIQGSSYVGGMVGHGYANMSNCTVEAEGTINSTYWCCGSLIGYIGENSTGRDCKVIGTGDDGLSLWSAMAGIGGAFGMPNEDCTFDNISVANVNIDTSEAYVGYGVGYIAGDYIIDPQNAVTNSVVSNVTAVVGDKNYIPSDATVAQVAVAEVNGKYFASLQDAFAAADDGDVIEVLGDVDMGTTALVVALGKNIVLDLNGKTISGKVGTSTYNDSGVVTNNGTLTIKDSVGNGKIEAVGGNNNAAFWNEVGATATLESGSIISTREGSAWNQSYYTLVNHGTMTINGGTVSTNDISSAMIENGWQFETQNTTQANSVMKINGGSFSGGKYNVKVDGYGVLTVNGGNFDIDRNTNILNWNQTTIKGGTFTSTKLNVWTGNGTAKSDEHKNAYVAKLNVTDGVFYAGTTPFAWASGNHHVSNVTGGIYDKAPSSDFLADGYVATLNPISNKYEVSGEELVANEISVVFEEVASGSEDEKLFNINLVATSDINEFASAEFTFVNTSTLNDGSVMPYVITAAENMTLTNPEAGYYGFAMDGVNKFEISGNKITIGQVRFTGYGDIDFNVASGIVNATTVLNNLVKTYTTNGAVSGDVTKGNLIIDTGVIDTAIAVPTRKLTITIDFPNAVKDNVADYQNMKVEITGVFNGVNKTVTYKLGTDEVVMGTDGSYVIENSDLVLNNAYTVTVSGAGYRTARYTVTMTDSKELKFWNNVMDEEQVVEIGKDTSAVKVTYLAGDIVKDNKINIYDLSAVVSYFGTTTDRAAKDDYVKYDLNRDGVIDSKDVAYVLVSWNN